jgi:hypothetical protein
MACLRAELQSCPRTVLVSRQTLGFAIVRTCLLNKMTIQHRMGRGGSNRSSRSPCHRRRFSLTRALSCTLRQLRSSHCLKQGPFSKPRDKYHSAEYLYCVSPTWSPFNSHLHSQSHQCSKRFIKGGHSILSERFSPSAHPFQPSPSESPFTAPHPISLTILPIFSTSITPQDTSQQLPCLYENTPSLRPNKTLCPKCKAEECIFLWKGVNTLPFPSSTIL